jgi:hypothetical protein
MWAKGGMIFWLDQVAILSDNNRLRSVTPIVGLVRTGTADRVARALAAELDVPYADILAVARGESELPSGSA